MSDDNVIQMPREEPPDLLIGPFTSYKVQVDGRIIPRLTGFREGDKIWLVVDDRFAQGFSTNEDAHGAAVLIGDVRDCKPCHTFSAVSKTISQCATISCPMVGKGP